MTMASRFEISPLHLTGLQLLQRRVLGDSRGYLERMFCSQDLEPVLNGLGVVQINHTLSARAGTVRGMHFQHAPHAETKLVSCLRGKVFDVAVDIRQGSPTFLAWRAEILSEENHRTLLIPEGFAHGFQTLSPDCEFLYIHTAPYRAEAEGALSPSDPALGIEWPLTITELSDRDKNHPMLTPSFKGIAV